MQDEVNEKTIGIGVRTATITAQAILMGLRAAQIELKQVKSGNHSKVKRGKQSLTNLSKQNAGLSSLELSDPNLRLLNRIMNKHGIDFAPVKTGKGNYLLFFKGRDADAMTLAFEKYTKAALRSENKKSILKTLAEKKDATKTLAADLMKTKIKNKEHSL